MTPRISTRIPWLVRLAAILLPAAGALAQPTFVSGTGSITHYQRYDATGIIRTPVAPNTNPFNLPVFNSSFFQYNSSTHPSGNIVVGPLTSTARGGIGQQTATNFFGIAFATGTNISQRGNADTTTVAASMITLDFNGTWSIGAVPLTGVTAGAFANLLGSLPTNASTFAQINLTANFDWHTAATGTFMPLRTPISATVVPTASGSFYLRQAPGSFAANPSNVIATTPSTIPAGATVRITGTISFMIHNDGGDANTKTDPAIPNIIEALPPMGIAFTPVQAPLPNPITTLNLDCPGPVQYAQFSLNGPTVRWFRFDLPSPVTLVDRNSLTIAAANVQGASDPIAIGLYNSFGGLIATDDSSGANRQLGQLSFGFGRQPGLQNGAADADGRNGELPAGTYYLGVANAGATFSTNRFVITPGAFGGTNRSAIIIRTDVPNCTTPPVSAPTPTLAIGPLNPTDFRSLPVLLDPTGPTWLTFELTAPIDASRPGGFLTIDTEGTVGVDTIVGLYDSLGRSVSTSWFDDDSFGDSLSQLDFRQPGAAAGPRGPANVPLNGYSGNTLPAGLYYLAVAPHRTRFGTRRWEVYTDTPAARTITVNLRTGDVVAPIVDGYLDSLYGPPLSVQDTQTAFGDASLGLINFANGSELDALYARVQDNTLYLLLTGNLETNFNKLEIFFDTTSGGQNVLRADNPNVDFNGLNRMSGLRFDAAFAPDYWISTTAGTSPIVPQFSYFVNYAELRTNGGGTGYYVGTNDGRGPALSGGTNPFGISAAIQNFNTAGVPGGTGLDPGSGATVPTGMEFAIPLAALGNPSSCCIRAFINGTGHAFVSNQFLSGLGGSPNLGDPHNVDLTQFGGACVPIFAFVATGACCASTGCSVASEAACAVAGGIYQGDGTSCSPYAAAPSASAFEDISGTGLAGPDGDDVNVVVGVGFDFTFFGNTYSQVSICTNGFLQFGNNPIAQTDVNVPLPSNGLGVPLNAVCGLWDDWVTAGGGAGIGGSGNIVYQTLGAAPNRRFIAQWTNVGQFNQPPQNAEGGPATFQVVLFEGTNNIEFRYGAITPDPTGGTPQADYTVGVQNADGTIGLNVDTTTLGAGNTALSITLSDPCANLCLADFNADGVLNADDLSDYITGYFDTPSDPRTDFNADGAINADDLGDFITAYFNGC